MQKQPSDSVSLPHLPAPRASILQTTGAQLSRRKPDPVELQSRLTRMQEASFDDQEILQKLKSKLLEMRKIIEDRDIKIAALQRNFETLVALSKQERAELEEVKRQLKDEVKTEDVIRLQKREEERLKNENSELNRQLLSLQTAITAFEKAKSLDERAHQSDRQAWENTIREKDFKIQDLTQNLNALQGTFQTLDTRHKSEIQ